jgi:hypothetical protein
MEAVVAKFPLTAHGRPTKKAKSAQEFVKHGTGLGRKILGEVFTMHDPLRNAWDPIVALVRTKMDVWCHP